MGNRIPKTVDINRDFPYNQAKESDCLNTIAGRIIYELFLENLFVSALTFHSGCTSIGYPWGSYNHMKDADNINGAASTESPDYFAFQRIGEIMNAGA